MDKKFQKLFEKLVKDPSGSFPGGFSRIRGGILPSTNSAQRGCTNGQAGGTGSCKGNNTGACTNWVECDGTNGFGCSNKATCNDTGQGSCAPS